MWFIRIWIPLAIAITLLCGLLYVVEQQNYRQSFNDPQVRMAEDAAMALRSGLKPATLVPTSQIDIANSIDPWLTIYDASGTPIVSSGALNGQFPQPPAGVFSDLRTGIAQDDELGHVLNTHELQQTNENRLTWEPQAGTREALVVVSAGKEFVVAGRNMREVEDEVWQMEIMIGIGWIVTLLATLLAVWLSSHVRDFITIARD